MNSNELPADWTDKQRAAFAALKASSEAYEAKEAQRPEPPKQGYEGRMDRRRSDRQVSKWNRPMRAFQPARLVCQECGEPVRVSQFGGWEHVRRGGIKDPRWHLVKEAA